MLMELQTIKPERILNYYKLYYTKKLTAWIHF